MTKIIKVEDMPFGDKLYLKKDIFGYRIVNPIKNEDGSINWINILFGGYRNLIFLILILLLTSFIIWSYNHDISEVKSYYGNISENPFYACSKNNVETSTYYQSTYLDETKDTG